MKLNISLSKLVILFVIAVGMWSCGQKESDEYVHKYMVVQLEDDGTTYNLINEKGEVVSNEPIFGSAVSAVYKDDVFWVQNEEGIALHSVSSPSDPINKERYVAVTPFLCNRAVVMQQDKPIQIIDSKGQLVKTLPDDIVAAYGFTNNGIAIVQFEGNSFGWIDETGTVLKKGFWSSQRSSWLGSSKIKA